MQRNLNFVNVGVGCVIVVILCLFITIMIYLLSPAQQGEGNTDNSTTTTTSSQSTSINTATGDVDGLLYAGIAPNKDIVGLDAEQGLLAVEIDDLDWQNIQFSPQGDYLSVLGRTNDSENYDLYLYPLPSVIREKLTVYESATSGVEEYIWINDTTILFTQGEENNRWLHKLNLNDRAVIKEFITPGKLIDAKENRLLFKDGENFAIYDLDGKRLQTVSASDFGFKQLINVNLLDQGLIINGIDEQDAEQYIFVDNRNIILDIDLPLLCVGNRTVGLKVEESKFEIVELSNGFREQALVFSRFINSENSPVVQVPQCDKDILINLSNQEKINWFVVRSENTIDLNEFSGFLELVIK